MDLFLTSSPCDDNVPEGLDQPCIWTEQNGFADALRARVFPGHRCLLIASASDAHAKNDEMIRTFHLCMKALGAEPLVTEILDDRSEADAAGLISAADCIILCGGHVPTQNAFFDRLGLARLLADYPGVVMGISAGSMNSCGEVYAQPEEPGEAVRPDYVRFLTGLGLTNVMILPHLNRVRYSTVDGLRLFEDISIPDSVGRTFYAIPDGSYVLQQPGQKPVMYGEAWQLRDGQMTLFCGDGESRVVE